ncbi:MAG: hypothetical protein AAB687_01615 [Patescibacteria group bacterium]
MKQRWIIAGIGMLLFGVTLGVFYLAKSSVEVKKMEEALADSVKVAQEQTIQTQTTQTEVLKLMYEGLTPCSVNINYRSRILRSDPIKIKFQNVSDWIKYPAKGDVTAPKEATSGETQFMSTDPTHPHVRVQVYKKMIIEEK